MYKVFINEKKLSINNSPTTVEKNIRFEGFTTFEIVFGQRSTGCDPSHRAEFHDTNSVNGQKPTFFLIFT